MDYGLVFFTIVLFLECLFTAYMKHVLFVSSCLVIIITINQTDGDGIFCTDSVLYGVDNSCTQITGAKCLQIVRLWLCIIIYSYGIHRSAKVWTKIMCFTKLIQDYSSLFLSIIHIDPPISIMNLSISRVIPTRSW